MTNNLLPWDTAHFDKWFVGADKVLKTLSTAHEQMAKNVPGYPPYNIVKNDDNHYTIELAVAGFAKQNLDIELANNTLVIKGGTNTTELDPVDHPIEYVWKGIADRFFTRKFTLADTVEVKNAEYINGMLKIFLENVVPDEKKARKVDIK
jgi:molecular chaperone IbpA